MRRFLAISAFAAVALGAAVATTSFAAAQGADGPASADAARQITIWRDPGCGCCDAYADYLERNGFRVSRVDDRNFDRRSVAAGVPEQGLGCHLSEIDGYYVSGLVPADIIERLVAERPAVTGITLPGMPSNAPGMAPEKTGTLRTYAFSDAGISVFSNE